MLSILKDHPFAVESFFDTSLVLTYAVPKEEIINLIPECLTLDLFEDKWAFIAVAMVKTRNLRPKGFPEFLGNNFILTGYRIFVKYITNEGKRLRGLYIIKSETDKSKMAFFGNIFTHYNYTTTDISFIKHLSSIEVNSKNSDLNISVVRGKTDVNLPLDSPFRVWKEARRFAGPLPFTFTYNPESKEVLIIEGVRQNWTPEPVEVIQNNVGFIKSLGLRNVILANAFVINNIPYYWKKGKKEIWKQP
jgi:uncharacterized protein YqjF (DUF2071 family)